MPRFFFDIHDGEDLPDEQGTECVDHEAARREAIRAAGEMLRDKQGIWGGETWTMTVRDEQSHIIFTLAFGVK